MSCVSKLTCYFVKLITVQKACDVTVLLDADAM